MEHPFSLLLLALLQAATSRFESSIGSMAPSNLRWESIRSAGIITRTVVRVLIPMTDGLLCYERSHVEFSVIVYRYSKSSPRHACSLYL
jgi:hypothetical protein